MKGRSGALLNDKRYWLAVSRKGHRFIEDNPKWAKDNGYSLYRL
jgi:frataxin-like iron-binding protein CyaY